MYKFIISSNNKNNWLKGNKKEFCFIGRSNVGKSTLINSLTNQKQLARISNTPGRTQLINFFQDENQNTLVDLPGYGYAKMPKKEKNKMICMIEEYFQYREELFKTLILIDCKIGPTKDDYEMMNFLKTIDRDFFIIITKIDKCNQSQVFKTEKKIKEIKIDYLKISSLKGININKLNKILNSWFK